MPEGVAFVVLRARVGGCEDLPRVGFDVAGVEELVVFVAGFAPVGHVGSDIVEVAEAAGELHVSGVVHAGGSEDDHAVLGRGGEDFREDIVGDGLGEVDARDFGGEGWVEFLDLEVVEVGLLD